MTVRSAYLVSNGCPENRVDLASMELMLGLNGYEIVNKPQQADVVIFNTCGLTRKSEQSTIGILQELNTRKRSSARLIVCGCLPRIDRSGIAAIHSGPIVDGDDMAALEGLLRLKNGTGRLTANFFGRRIGNRRALRPLSVRWMSALNAVHHFAGTDLLEAKLLKFLLERMPAVRESGVGGTGIYPIKVCSGCLSACSYCAVRLSRGRLTSKPIDQVLKEFEKGLQNGAREICLVGTNVGAYGRDRGMTLVDLLNAMVRFDGDYTIKVRNLHAGNLIEMLPDLREALESGRVSSILSAVQSGSNRILKLMKRHYRAEDYTAAVRELQHQFPRVKLRTQIMVGFPTETDDDFADTMRLIDDLEHDFVEVYRFQARPGTAAFAMEDQVPDAVAKKRYVRALRKVFAQRLKRRFSSLTTPAEFSLHGKSHLYAG